MKGLTPATPISSDAEELATGAAAASINLAMCVVRHKITCRRWPVPYPDEQQKTAAADSDRCEAELKKSGLIKDPQPLSRETLEANYDKQIEIQQCLGKEGIAPGKTPSKEAYVDSKGAWSPYDAFDGSQGPEAWARINNACPQLGLEN